MIDPLELTEVAEYLVGRPDRLTGAGFRQIRMALRLSEHALAVELETTERSIIEIESDRKANAPEALDLKLRKLFTSP